MRLALLLSLTALPAAADPVELATAATRASCAEAGQVLVLGPAPLTEVDLTGDGVMDAVVSEEGARCDPDGGYLGGSGGSTIHFVVGERVHSVLAGSWAVTDTVFTVEGEAMPPVRTVLVALHGSACDAYGAARCIEALVWDAGEQRFLTVAPPPEGEAP